MASPGTVVDFYKLTRPVQERFRGSVNGSGLPAPILSFRQASREPLVWLGGSAALLVFAFIVFELGLGSLDSGISIQGAGWVVLHTLLWGGVAFGILRALAIRRESRSLPFVPGVYIFPIGLVDARRYHIHVVPLGQIGAIEGPDASNSFRVTALGTQFVFPCKDKEAAEKASAALAEARGTHQEANEARESIRPKALAAIDPLQDGGFASPLVPKTPIVRVVPFWAARAWAVALAAGFLFGLAVWNARNVLSDARMFATANEKHDTASYKAYLEHGTRHKDEVELTLLPRAELKDAQKAGTVQAIEDFMKKHPKTKIGPEVQAARRTALLAELEDVKKVGTLTALKEFDKGHPDHHLDAEIAAAVHQVYVAAFAKYQADYASKDAAAAAFVQRLLDFAEKHGPQVVIRFQRKVAKSMERADKAVAKNKNFMGSATFPSRFFDAAHDKPREAEMGQAIVQRFAEAFPADLLKVEIGDPIADPEEALPGNVTTPTLFVLHTTEWSGGEISSSQRPRGDFVMLGFTFEAYFRLPDDAKPLAVKQVVWRRPETSIAKDEEHPEEPIYTSMSKDGFDAFGKKLLATFFRTDKDKH